MTGHLAVGVDAGGTKIVAGLVAGDGTVVTRLRRTTPRGGDGDAITEVIAGAVEELCTSGPLPVGVGAAGIVDPAGTVRYAPNIPAWADYPLAAALHARLRVPVVVGNDANVAAWGEYRVGAGSGGTGAGGGPRSMVMLTVGTGVGGGLVLDGKLVVGQHGLGAEFGHIVVAEGGPRCGCGNHGCLEALASGTAIGRAAEEAAAEGRIPPASRLAAAERPLLGKAVTVAAYAGDEFAVALLAERGFWLGVGISALVNALDPALVVVGGGAMEAGEFLLAPARAAAAERVMGQAHRVLPPIVAAELGDEAGIVGAALLALVP